MRIVPVRISYLEMRCPPNYATAPPRSDCVIMWLRNPTLSFYKFLYRAVGEKWFWVKRRMLADQALKAIVTDLLVEIYVLYVGGAPAGFIELDRRTTGEIEIVYFGIMPEFMGWRFGEYLLRWAVKRAWRHNPTRVWLHTCEFDHPAAKPLYLKAGFVQYDEEVAPQKLPGASEMLW